MSPVDDDSRPPASLRPFTARLAELLATEDGTQTLAVLQRLGRTIARRGDEEPTVRESLQLGVWGPELHPDGTVDFVRSESRAAEWRFWADVERIPPKRGPRVVLLGESVARGYLFDPAITPARMLEAALSSVAGLEDAEVVDLARSDLTQAGLPPLFDLLPALEPDAAVLFAGNNWPNLSYEADDLQRLATALRQEGYAGCRRVLIDEILGPRCRSTMDSLAASAEEFDIPVVVIVPEFNLMDWRPEPAVLTPLLRGGRHVEWLEARRLVERALAEGRHEEAERYAVELTALDGGTSAVGPDLLGRVALALGRTEEARSALEAARDAVCGTMVAHSPRCPAVVQEALRDSAARHGFEVVDLPEMFARRDGGDALPDRTLFLDYCHLTVEGMRLAVVPTAERLVRVLTGRATDLGGFDPDIDPTDEGIGHFLAAIHNAHYGQPGEVVRHHCARAAGLSAEVRDRMLDYIDCRAHSSEPWTHRSFERLVESPVVRRYLAPVDPRGMAALADFDLLEKVAEALEEQGVQARSRLEGLLRTDLAQPARPVNLLDRRFHAASFREREGHTLGPARAFHRSTDVRSRFFLVLAEAGPVLFSATCRLPGAGDELAHVDVRANGVAVGSFAAGAEWETFTLDVPAGALRPGVNAIELRWPMREPPWEEEIERAARRLERGIYPDPLPAFGEVHALAARWAQATTPDPAAVSVAR